ncbi:MAG: FlaD/FlaE family flagellar protein [Candidatus Hecatellaceae archaeon]
MENIGETGEGNVSSTLSTEIFELKRKISELEKNFNSLSEVLKKTLTDVRSVISELDNPFNILRSVGVDELLEKCIEHVREEVGKIKREEMKKSAVKDDEVKVQPQIVACREVKVEGETRGKSSGKPEEGEAKPSCRLTPPELKVEKPATSTQPKDESKPPSVFEFKPSVESFEEAFSIYRLAHLMLAAGYLMLRVGRREAELIITEYVKRGWVDPSTARELEDFLGMLSLEVGENLVGDGKIDVEDHLLLVDYLRRVGKMTSAEENPSNILSMLFLSKAISYMLQCSLARRGELDGRVF